MIGTHKVFALAAIDQSQVSFVNQLAGLIKSSDLIDHAIVVTDSQHVFEAAAIAGLSAHHVADLSFELPAVFAHLLDSEEVYLSEELEAWFIFFDASQRALSASEISSVFDFLGNETVVSVFTSDVKPSSRFFTAASFRKDADFIAADIQWLNLITGESFR
jgi:hypothetical protein